MRKAISFTPEYEDQPDIKVALMSKYSSRQSPSTKLSSYLKTRNSYKKDYQQKKQDIQEEKMKHILKQRAIMRKGNLIIQQLNERKKLLEDVSLTEMTREEALMEELLMTLLRFGTPEEKLSTLIKYQKNEQNEKQNQDKPIQYNEQKKIFSRGQDCQKRQNNFLMENNSKPSKRFTIPQLNMKLVRQPR